MEFKLNKYSRNISEAELIKDLRKVAKLHNTSIVRRRDYDRVGRYSSSAYRNHFGSWNNAVRLAGLKPSKSFNTTKAELFVNLMKVWLKLKRQPRCAEMNTPASKFSVHVYIHKFGSFRKALEEFVMITDRKNKQGLQESFIINTCTLKVKRNKTKRTVNYALRYKVLTRDDYTCVKCGSSPATEKGVKLEIDHIKPYSKGGETVMSNLQTLCRECNIGKGNR